MLNRKEFIDHIAGKLLNLEMKFNEEFDKGNHEYAVDILLRKLHFFEEELPTLDVTITEVIQRVEKFKLLAKECRPFNESK